jgi:hypothetical protein
MKLCPICKINNRDTKHSYCRNCRTLKQREYNKKYRSTDHGKQKMLELVNAWNRNKNGFTENLFKEILEYQNYSCAICGVDKPSKSGKKDWHADHDHDTGKARGILCAGCNTLLGRLESVGFDWVDKAKIYLKI